MPNLVKLSLEKGKIKENDWEDDKQLNKLINDCINIENNIKNINIVYERIKTFNSNKELDIEFYPKNEDIEKGLLKEIRNFGSIKEVKEKQMNIIKEKENASFQANNVNENKIFW